MEEEYVTMLKIRKASVEDVPLILSFIRELAEYEREPGAVRATEDDLIRDGFSANPKFRVLIAEWDGSPAGMAFFSRIIQLGRECMASS